MATEGGSSALGLPGGRMEPGAAADLIVVDFEAPRMTPVHEYVSQLVYAAHGDDVRHTMVNGDVLMEDRDVLPLDETAVRETARKIAGDLVDRA